MIEMKESLFGKTLAQIETITARLGAPRFAARQVTDWLYRKHGREIAGMTDLSKELRARLAETYDVGTVAPERERSSTDGTKKYLFPAAGRFVEAAYIPEPHRATLCLSTQVGCKMGCLFCMTGKQGFQANLDAGAILNQLERLPERDAVTNVVYMGMGEPFDNLQSVLASLEILTAPWGYGMSPRRITVSTIGVVPAIQEFLEKSTCHLAVSMHSPFDEERKRLMPVQHVYPLESVLDALRAADVEKRRRVSFEYILFNGINDTPRHAREIVKLLHGIRARVNLIHFHPIPDTPLAPSPPERMVAFENELKAHGLTATIRKSRGQDIQAACGLLSTKALIGAVARDY